MLVDHMTPPAVHMVIDFRADGQAQAMHRDGFPLAFLGKQTVRRASEIRFDEATQDWFVELLDDDGNALPVVDEARGFDTYDEGRKMEVRWLEMSRMHGLEPLSPEGITLLRVLRTQFE